MNTLLKHSININFNIICHYNILLNAAQLFFFYLTANTFTEVIYYHPPLLLQASINNLQLRSDLVETKYPWHHPITTVIKILVIIHNDDMFLIGQHSFEYNKRIPNNSLLLNTCWINLADQVLVWGVVVWRGRSTKREPIVGSSTRGGINFQVQEALLLKRI